MLEIRELEKKDHLEWKTLLHTCFQILPPDDFFFDFPVWHYLEKEDKCYRIGVWMNQTLVSSGGIRKAFLQNKPGFSSVPIGLIGCISTHPSFEKRGYAQAILKRLILWAEQEQLSALLLWGKDQSFYQKEGFHLEGRVFSLSLATILKKTMIKKKKFILSQAWDPQLFHEMKKRKEGLLLEEKDKKWIEKHKNVQWYIAYDHAHHILAYAGIGKGIDLHQIVHEWGGQKDYLFLLFKKIRTDFPNGIVWMSEKQAHSLFSHIPLTFFSSEGLTRLKILDSPTWDTFLSENNKNFFWIWGLQGA